MNKYVKYALIGVLVLGALWAAAFFIKSNSKSSITYETKKPFISSIEKKTVATGKVDTSGGGRDQTTDLGYH